MILYEVNLKINHDLYAEYLMWLSEHVKEILQFPGFIKASIFHEEREEQDQFEGVTVHYYVQSREQLEDYFREHAARMRAETLKRFNSNFSVTRRVLNLM
ncbi:MAG: DUF4286 family protein [Legionella sp.]|nr:MAG: DUF4286 family protein [Legionella sp.]